MQERIRIRKATDVDAGVVSRIYLASRKTLVDFAPLAHSDASIYSWIREVLIPTNWVFIADEKGVSIGMMSLSKKDDIGWIDHFYLMPHVVGRGIGTILLLEAKSILKSPVRLITFQQNIGARRFYERHGFEIVEFTDGSANEEKCPDMVYEWRM